MFVLFPTSECLEVLVKQNVETFNEFVADFSWYEDPTLP